MSTLDEQVARKYLALKESAKTRGKTLSEVNLILKGIERKLNA